MFYIVVDIIFFRDHRNYPAVFVSPEESNFRKENNIPVTIYQNI